MESESLTRGWAFRQKWVWANALGLGIGFMLAEAMRAVLNMGFYTPVEVVRLLSSHIPSDYRFFATLTGLVFGAMVGFSIGVLHHFKYLHHDKLGLTLVSAAIFGALAVVIFELMPRRGFQWSWDIERALKLSWFGIIGGIVVGLGTRIAYTVGLQFKFNRWILVGTLSGALIGAVLFMISQAVLSPVRPNDPPLLFQLRYLFDKTGRSLWYEIDLRSEKRYLVLMAGYFLALLVVGIAQWLFFRRLYHGTKRWILATTLGGLLAWVVGAPSSVQLGLDWRDLKFFIIPSMLLGITQWLVLRGWVRYASWWIPAATVGWSIGSLAGQLMVIIPLALNVRDALGFVILIMLCGPGFAFMSGLIGGAIYGIITLLALDRLVRLPVQPSPSSPIPESSSR